jgi:prolyl 4-hydroxylase
MAFKPSSIIEYAIIAVPLYLFAISPLLRSLFPTSSTNSAASYQSFEKTDKLIIPDDSLQCPPHQYTTYIGHHEPLVIYIENFLSDAEADHLVQLAEKSYQKSTVFTGETESFDPKIRNSSKALLPRDEVVQCIEQRAREFQGWKKDVYIERLWAQRYEAGGHYTYHYDWSGDLRQRSGGRLSTFMVYLGADCTGGGTKFPRLEKPEGGRWCEFVECGDELAASADAEGEGGIVIKPRKGAAVYWENFRPDGSGYEDTWHAGLPVKTGHKIGLNIWSWWQPGYGEALLRQEEEEGRVRLERENAASGEL